jgi:pilus assembly protein CpaF
MIPIDFGPLKKLLTDPAITEIMVNAWDRVFIEQDGVINEVQVRFTSSKQYDSLVQSLVSSDSEFKANSLHYDGILAEGFRFNLVLPPMSPSGPALTIRKFRSKAFSFDDLIRAGTLSEKAARFLDAAVKARISILVSGGTGTGKTTILNSLAASIPGDERVVSIQDVGELRLPLRNWVSLVTTEATSARDCLVNALRMRPDRIIVGECRRDETFEMLQAMNSGHDGSMTTLHANSALEALTRIESLVLYSKFELPMKALRYQISEAIDLIVQLRRNSSGKREIVEIIELTGMENDTISRGVIFQKDKNGVLVSVGYVPECLEQIRAAKMDFAPGFF